jgi:hypothetical protein
MTIIRVECHENFKEDDVVLLALDTDGVRVFAGALTDAIRAKGTIVRVPTTDTSTNLIVVAGREARVEVQPGRVTWHLSEAKATEIFEKLESMQRSSKPAHHYVDIDGVYDTLIISQNEYV